MPTKAEIEAEAKAKEDEIAELRQQVEVLMKQAGSGGRRVFTITGAVPPEKAREEVLAARSEEPKTYRALENGTDLKQGFVPKGAIFTTTQPKGSWMEPVED